MQKASTTKTTLGLFPWTTNSNLWVLANKPESKKEIPYGISFLIACSAPSALCYAILAISPKSVIPSGAKFESRTSYLRSMRILIGQEVQRLRRCSILWIPHFTKLRGASKETLILRLNQRFPSCFQTLISKNQKSPCKGSPPYATILKALGWPGFFKCEFSTCTDSVICDILIKHVNWPSAEERWNEV